MDQEIIARAAHILPSRRQADWMDLELTAFIHFSLNTYYDREWGDGTENPARFNPVQCEPREWIRLLAECGFKLAILTCKHHGGFCLWPSAYTDYSVASSPWKQGKGDLVREVADACREFGVKFGVYLSPWDRHEPTYGDSPAYNRYFMNQLRELLSNYGEVYCVWFDGACVPVNGKVQEYAWNDYYELIHKLQPNALISGIGPDIRWCGNEAGKARKAEWAVLNVDKNWLRFNYENCRLEDIGDLGDGKALRWYPAEVDTSIRPNWFYHTYDDTEVKSQRRLFECYRNSVGHNSVLLLNLPPNPKGCIAREDAERLRAFAKMLRQTYEQDYAAGAQIKRNSEMDLVMRLPVLSSFNAVSLAEDIRQAGQRVESFLIEGRSNGGEWTQLYAGYTIGHRELAYFQKVEADEVRVRITASRDIPMLLTPHIYCFPEMGEDKKNVYEQMYAAKNMQYLASSESQKFPADNLKQWEIWRSDPSQTKPQWVAINLNADVDLKGFFIKPIDDGQAGLIQRWQCDVSPDGEHWTRAGQGEFQNMANNPIFQKVYFEQTRKAVRWIRLTALSTYDGTSLVALKAFHALKAEA